jgi:probable F420-dependent oxidoreductase
MLEPTAPASQPPPIAAWLTLEGQPADRCRSIARSVEDLGYDTVWIPETPTSREVFSQAGVLLAATDTLHVGTGIANIWARDATATAAARETLNDAYPGRFVLGLGTSHATRVADRGHGYRKPLTFMREYLDAMEQAGPFRPEPAQSGPTVLAALRPRMQGLARDRTDGMHSFFVTIEHTAAARQRLGDNPLLIPHQAFVINAPSVDAQALARAFVASRLALPNYVNHLLGLGFSDSDLADGGSAHLIDSLVAVGDDEAVAMRMRAHLEAGATHVAAHPLADAADGGVGQLSRLAAPLLGSA